MMVLFDRLYQSDDYGAVQVEGYLNELLTNRMKYDFGGREGGRIRADGQRRSWIEPRFPSAGP